jgi:catechol 2,3-dioxygenase-like lactoylglutathione lyase family enzyme
MITFISIGVDDCAATAPVYEAICAVRPQFNSDNRCSFRFSGATIELVGGAPTGINEIRVLEQDLDAAEARLDHSGLKHLVTRNGITIDGKEACGLVFQLSDKSEETPASTSRLDHVALRVFDLEESTRRWQAIVGATAEILGVHPVSNGAFEASRFLLGDQMIELVAPVPGVDSAIAKRLESHGEGVATLAIPAADVERTKLKLEQLGAHVLWSEPHWMVHPRDTSGVLVQLTPRVAH